MFFKKALHRVTEFVFTCRCLACGALIERTDETPSVHNYFCLPCEQSIRYLHSPFCPVCAQPHDTGAHNHKCGACLISHPPFRRVTAPFVYGGALACAMQRFKYAPNPHLAKGLGELMFAQIELEVDVIIPVPLHHRSLVRRGFNQSALLAAVGQKKWRIPLRTDLVQRVGHDESQVGKNRKERLVALKHAFVVPPRKNGLLTGKRVLLVDDVVTTTATTRCVAKMIKSKLKADEVDVICLARSV